MKSDITRHIWLGLAIFFLVFNSSPVKKLIRIYFYGAPAATTSDTEFLVNKTFKDCCSILDRHDISTETTSAAEHQDTTDFLYLLTDLMAVALLCTFVKGSRPQFIFREAPANKGSAPLYLQVRKLQI